MKPETNVQHILAECLVAIVRGLGQRDIDPAAIAFWYDRYLERFSAALQERNHDWNRDRAHVLARAKRLAETAVALCDRDGAASITARHAQDASDLTDCRPSSLHQSLTGWCIPPGQPSPGETEGEDVMPTRMVRPLIAPVAR